MIYSHDSLVPLIDEEGHVLDAMTRSEAHNGSRKLHPVVHLHVFNSRGELYLQQRPDWKDIQPGKWDTAVGGHVDYVESIGEALKREVREEIGITDYNPHEIARYIYDSLREREMVHVHTTIYDGAIVPDKEELAGGKFWKREDIEKNLGKGVFTPNFEQEYIRFFQKKEKETIYPI